MLPVKEFRLKNISVLTWLFGLEEPFPLEEDQLPSFLSLQSSFHWRENTRSERLRSIQWFKAYKMITEAYNQPLYLLIMVIKYQLTIINVLYNTLIIFHRRSDYKINKHLYALSFQIMCVCQILCLFDEGIYNLLICSNICMLEELCFVWRNQLSAHVPTGK